MFAIRQATAKNLSRRRAQTRGRILLAFCVVVLCLAGCWQGVQAARPFVLANRLRTENDRIEREMMRLRLQNQRAEEDVKELETPEGVQREARKLGWTLAEERRLRVPER